MIERKQLGDTVYLFGKKTSKVVAPVFGHIMNTQSNLISYHKMTIFQKCGFTVYIKDS